MEKDEEKRLTQNLFSEVSDADVEGFLSDIFPKEQSLPEIDENGGATDTPTESMGLRSHYDDEVKAIRGRWGDLEVIRSRLGLSRRKISQLLLVDPSAWTRWTRDGQDAPAYIYRSLEWYLTLSEKDPSKLPRPIGFGTPDIQRIVKENVAKAVAAQKPVIITAGTAKPNPETEKQLQESFDNMKAHSRRLDQRIQELQQIGAGWKALLLINTLVWIGAGIFLLIR